MENPLIRIIRRSKSANLTPDGLRITEFPAPVTNLLRMYGMGGTYAAIYASQPNVRAVVDDLAREAAQLTLKQYLKDPRGALFPDARIEVDHPMMDLLKNPMPRLSLHRFWFSLFADIGIYDLAVWWKIRNGGLAPKGLLRIPPANIAPQYDAFTGQITEWTASNGKRIPPDDLVVFWGYDPAMNNGSIAPLETLRRVLAEEQAAGSDRENRWHNALRKDGVIERALEAPKMSDEARESFLTDVEAALSGSANTATPLMLEPGMSWKDIEWSPKEMEYINGRKLNRTEVAAQYHYPAAKVLAGPGDPTAETLHYFYTSTLPPYLSRVESEIEAQLLPDFEVSAKTRATYYVEFNLDAVLRGSFEQQAQIMATTAGGPVVTVNEARARMNLVPIEGGDQIFVPLNSMRGGGPQGAPQAPLDTPAPGLNPIGTTPSPLPSNSPPALPAGAVSLTGAEAKELLAEDATGDTVEAILAKHDLALDRVRSKRAQVEFLREARARFEERHAKMFEKHFARQKNALKSGNDDLASKRWNKELAQDLYSVSLQTVEHVGKHTASSFGGDWSTDRTDAYLHASAEANAEAINEGSKSVLASELEKHGVAKIADLLRPGTGEAIEAFNELSTVLFGDERISELAVAKSTESIGWGTSEAGHQNEHRRLLKTWFTTSQAPRASHAALDGVTIPYQNIFANGLRYPGDGSTGDANEVANCACIMSVSE